MNDQRAFWISGLGSLAVVVLLGSALWARSHWADSNPAAVVPVSASAMVAEPPGSDQDALRKELEVAYSDLDLAYREIERLQAAGNSQDDEHDDEDHHERRGESDERDNEDHQ